MGKNTFSKLVLIIVLVLLSVWLLYPWGKTIKLGTDLAGGTSMIFEVDDTGLLPIQKRGLSQNMITVLRRRIDPANVQNLIWRPQGNTRFEIQMPLASAETVEKRIAYDTARTALEIENINLANVIRSLELPKAERDKKFVTFAGDSPARLDILIDLAKAYDQRNQLQTQRDELSGQMTATEDKLTSADMNVDTVKANVASWSKLDPDALTEAVKGFVADANDTADIEVLKQYTTQYSSWAKVVNQLTEPDTGVDEEYKQAKKTLEDINISVEALDVILEMPKKSHDRQKKIETIRTVFNDRLDKIDALLTAFEGYRPFRGRLDDPEDLKRMLKGAGVLEFRILPTAEDGVTDLDSMEDYIERLKSKGPKLASDSQYIWCQIEKVEEWGVPGSIVGKFGEKYYVLASNKNDEKLLHSTEGPESWKLVGARPDQDRMGRRAIGFLLDERGGNYFYNITRKNIDRPLCILLDGQAISAPNINSAIHKSGTITGSFSAMEQLDMVNKLNAGSLPARLIEQPVSEKTIGPSIGAVNRDQGIRAGFIGLFVVAGFILVYYLLAGGIADIALIMNILFILAIMALSRATFTLPGIAGLILTIGMSVDANVLIFERIREEQQKGSSLRIAIRNGYQRAFRTILDANITTFITALILFWVASEEIKGFAIVLMLGIVSSMFTALFVTRVAFDMLLSARLIKDHLVMLRIVKKPNFNWMKAKNVFMAVSIVLVAAGLYMFFNRGVDKYDIEFTGGTSVQINLKEDYKLSRQQVEDKVHQAGLTAANVYSLGKPIEEADGDDKIFAQYEINTTETNRTTSTLTFASAGKTESDVITAIEKSQLQLGAYMSNLIVTPDANNTVAFTVSTSSANKSMVRAVLDSAFDANSTVISEPIVDEIVNNAVAKAFEGVLEIQEDLKAAVISDSKITEDIVDAMPELVDFLGGVKVTFNLQKPATKAHFETRLMDLRFKPDAQELDWYSYRILNTDLSEITDAEKPMTKFAYVSVKPEAGLRQLSDEEWSQFVGNEKSRITSAASLQTSLPRLTQIDPSIGSEAKTRALIAIVLSLFAIVAYIWIRFGNVRYGVAAIAALVHDVCITLGAVVVCTYIAKTPIGEKLLIGDFKINLPMIAAFLTIIGYSLNDTIVVFDRIRENRGKGQLSPQIVTNSINQTLSRTLLTSFTTFVVVLVMYIWGAPSLRGFTFAMLFGILVGTYSSIAIAAPILLMGKKAEKKKS